MSKPFTEVEKQGLTPIAEWHRARTQGVKFHFPSGFVGLVRPMNVDAFLKIGNIPDLLTPTVNKLLSGEASLETLPVSDYGKSLEMINAFCKGAYVWPRIVDKIEDPENEVLINDIPDVDKQTLFAFMGAPASSLESFRPEKDEPVANLDDVQGDTPIAK